MVRLGNRGMNAELVGKRKENNQMGFSSMEHAEM